MTEFLQFLRILNKNRIILVLVPLITVVVCFFLVRELPDQYKSHGSLSTGLVDKSEQILSDGKTDQDSEINRKFDNLIQMMFLKIVLDQVSLQLILHDLNAAPDKTFRPLTGRVKEMTKAERQKVIGLFTKKYKAREELIVGNKQDEELQKIISEMGYDPGNVQKALVIYRLKTSDYINIEYEAENPELTAFVINTLMQEFISFNSFRLVNNNTKAIKFLSDFLNSKRAALNEKMNALKSFKIQNRILNLNEQARSLYGQISDFETRREVAEKDIVAYAAAIKNIDNKFNPADRKYLESALTNINQSIIATKQNMKSVNEAYVKSNFDPKLKSELDSLQNKLTLQINEGTDRYIYNPLVIKENLVAQKLNMEIAWELSSNSVTSIQTELIRLNKKFDELVPNEASIQEFETGIDLASKEYIEALQRYNNATLESSFPIQLRLVEKAILGSVQPSKKLVLIILSAIISIVFCLFVFFIIYLLDSSIRYPLQLANATERPVLGYLNLVNKEMDLSKLDGNSEEKSMHLYRNLVRSIRYELDLEQPSPKMIAFTSLSEKSGKTLLTLSLAWAFSKINKKVLIIDGNFSYSEITKLNGGLNYLEDFFARDSNFDLGNFSGSLSFLGNRGGDVSLFELADENQIRDRIKTLKTRFDIILVETDSLVAMNKAKEWIEFSDIVVAAFEAGNSISDDDRSKIEYLKNLNGKLSGWVLTSTIDIAEQAGKISKKLTE